MPAPRVLIIEDTSSMAALYTRYLQGIGYEADSAGEARPALAMMAQRPYEAVVLDLHLPDIDGLEVLRCLRQDYEDVPVVIVTAYGSIHGAVNAMKLGAFDFITKPFAASRLQTTLTKALEDRKLRRELGELRREVYQENYQDFVGSSAAMQALFRQIEAVAPSKASIFITGESGTGKELVAHALHKASPRAPKPFVAINCAAIPRELMESEIFGHVKGAFTSAASDRKGAAAKADGGTLFLDEICEMPPDMQVKLLRFIQTGSFTPVGSDTPQKSDLRIVSATNRDVHQEVEEGRFREDLFYRLYVVPLELPPLRERENDVVMLAQHFLKRFSAQEGKNFTSFEPEVISFFLQADWPGNVRQLENLIQQIVVLQQDPVVTMDMLPNHLKPPETETPAAEGNFIPFLVKPLWQIEKEAIQKALRASYNDVPRAAALLEVSPSTIYRKLQAWKTDVAAVAAE